MVPAASESERSVIDSYRPASAAHMEAASEGRRWTC